MQHSSVKFHIEDQTTDGFLIRGGDVEQVRFEIEELDLGSIMMGQLPRARQKRFVTALDGRPRAVIANQGADHDAPVLADRLQHDAWDAEYAIVIMGAESQQ